MGWQNGYLSSAKREGAVACADQYSWRWVEQGRERIPDRLQYFFKQGFAVVNIEYRLTGQATAPAAVEDTRCALIYLIKNATALNIDVHKIVLMGGSSGGHLALMGGLLGNDHRFDGNCPGVENIKVAAIIDKYGITDVWDWGYGPNITSNCRPLAGRQSQ